MIDSVTVTNELNESLDLILTRPELSGFVVTSIDGLGPVDANINMTELATLDGAIFNSARLNSRQITISLRFLENPTIEDTRLRSYKYFPIKKKVRLTFNDPVDTEMIRNNNITITGKRKCYVEGMVEKNEPDIFSKEESCKITIKCADPYFYYNGADQLNFFGIIPLFEFPFSNESLSENLINFGEIQQVTNGTFFYDGDSNTGVEITIYTTGPVTGIWIVHQETGAQMRIDDTKLAALMGGTGFTAGDTMIINTNRGKKSIRMFRGGHETNVLNSLIAPIDWFQIVKGYNTFSYHAQGLQNMRFTVTYKLTYEGI
jgi:hypothetical protein